MCTYFGFCVLAVAEECDDIEKLINDGRIHPARIEEMTEKVKRDMDITIKDAGVHLLTVKKKDATGAVISKVQMYKTFSYSEEYNMFFDETEGAELMETLAVSGKGKQIQDSSEIYEEIEKTLKRSYDPRIPFIIIALTLFLLDIAVRKFKFKWPHEIVRDYKAKKLLKQKAI